MFFFGLFSTHLPYIILSVLYLVGFGAFSANLIRDKISSNPPEAKIIHVTLKQSVQPSAKDFHFSYYNKTVFSKNYKSTKEQELSIVYKVILPKIIYKQFNYCYISSFNFSIFSRPPPSLLYLIKIS